MATPALMEVDNDDNVVDIINCVGLYYEKVPVESISFERKI